MTTNYEVIDQFFAAQVACNESEATLKTLRPQVETAVQALIKEQGKPSDPFIEREQKAYSESRSLSFQKESEKESE